MCWLVIAIVSDGGDKECGVVVESRLVRETDRNADNTYAT
jgi:hypothetical protein